MLDTFQIVRGLSESGRITDFHANEEGQLILILSGLLKIKTHNESWYAPPNTAIWIAPEFKHQAHAMKDTHFISLYVNATRYQFPAAPKILDAQGFLTLSLQKLLSKNSSDVAEGLLTLIANTVETSSSMPFHLVFPSDPRAVKFHKLLEEEPSLISIDKISPACGTSHKTLNRLFLKETGISIKTWMLRYKIFLATQLLETQSITTTALDLGYSSLSAFIYAFRQVTHMTPSAYRKKHASLASQPTDKKMQKCA